MVAWRYDRILSSRDENNILPFATLIHKNIILFSSLKDKIHTVRVIFLSIYIFTSTDHLVIVYS